MDKSRRKSLIIVSIVGTFIITLALIGITYAYYVASISWCASTPKITANTPAANSLKIEFIGSATITGTNILPGWTKSVQFTIKNTSSVNVAVKYNLKFSAATNTIGTNVIYYMSCTGTGAPANIVESSNKQWPTGATTIQSSISIGQNVTHTCTLTAKYKNASSSQNSEMGKNFSGTITIDAAQLTA